MKSVFLSIAIILSAAVGHANTQVPFIFGGEDVKADDPIAKFTVALTDEGQFACTASIIGDHMALTAAHCVDSDMSLLFSLGAYDENAPNVKITDYDVNENYDGNDDTKAGDIALLYFAQDLPTGYAPIEQLPNDQALTKGEVVTLAGYGHSSADGTGDAGTLRKTNVKIQNPDFNAWEITFDQTKGSGACYGDSGGPALVKFNDKYYQVGITSRSNAGMNNQRCDVEVVYSATQKYHDWIQTHGAALLKKHAHIRH